MCYGDAISGGNRVSNRGFQFNLTGIRPHTNPLRADERTFNAPCQSIDRPYRDAPSLAQGVLSLLVLFLHEGVDNPVGRSVVDQFTISKDHQPPAMPLSHVQVVGDEDDALTLCGQAGKHAEE